MATDLGEARAAPTAKHESFVQAQLARAERRIRALDLAAALLAFAAGTLAFAVGMALLDHGLGLSQGARQAGFVVYLLAAAAYLAWFVALPLSRRINPYFAARQLERTLPGAKNSVVNWLDLHGQDLAPAIRGAVGRRAAKDLTDADLDKAVSARRAYTAGGVAALCALAFGVALAVLGPGRFFGFLGRAFAPFGASGAAAPATGTRLTIVKPAEGDAVVPDDRPVDILIRVDGRIPDPRAADALKVQFRYEPNAPYEQRLLEPDDGGRWGVSLPPVDVKDGFWYKVTGGDAETPEHRVRLTPRVLDFKAAYEFRSYTARPKETRIQRKIEALRGTRVNVTAHVNREVKDGWLQFEGANGVTVTHGDRLPDDAQAFVVHVTLDESSQYRICFTSVEGENFVESQPYPLIAVPDKAPIVTLTKPAELKDKPGWVPSLQSDGLLELEGSATDDVGIKAMRLNLQVVDGPTLPPQDYRSPKEFQLPHGGNPTAVDYKDFVDLAKAKNPADPVFTVRSGMVLEYWLTAEDACDYPNANVGESKHYRVQIVDPLKNDQAGRQQRDKAEKTKQDNEQNQDKKNQEEDKKRQEQNQKNQQGDGSGGDGQSKPKDGGEKGGEQNQGNQQPKEGANSQPKPGDQGQQPNKPDAQGQQPNKPGDQGQQPNKPGDQGQQPNKPGDQGQQPNKPDAQGQQPNKPGDQGQQPNKPGDQGQQPNKPDGSNQQQPGGQGDKSDKPNPDKGNSGDEGGLSDGVKAAADQIRKDQEGKSKSDAQQQPADGKDGGQEQKQPSPADGKDGGARQEQKDAAQPKDGPQKQAGDQHDEGAAKQEGRPDAKQPQQGDAKAGGDSKTPQDGQPGESKDGKTEQAPQPSASKDGGKPGDKQQAGTDKPQTGGMGDKAEKKEGNSSGATADAQPAADAKDKAAPETKSEAKGAGPDNPDKDTAKADPKGGAPNAGSEAKQGPPPQDAGDPKADGSEGQPPSNDKTGDAAAALKQLKDDLKSDDPKRREAAEDFVRRFMMKSENQQTRDAGREALKEAKIDPDDNQTAQSKPQEPTAGPPMGPKEKPADGKGGADSQPQADGKENPPNPPDKDAAMGEPKGDGKRRNDAPPTDKPAATPAEAKGGPGNGARNRREELPPDDTHSPAAAPEAPVAEKASTLQLLKFYQAVPKDVLKDAALDPDKWKALEAAARDYWAKHPQDGQEGPAGVQQGGALGSTTVKVGDAGAKGPTDDPNNGGRALPPPGYRDPYKEFTKLLSPGGDK